MSEQREADFYDELERRLVNVGLSHGRARALTAALLAREDTKATALDELARHLDGELEQLTDVLARLDQHVADLSRSANGSPKTHKHHPIKNAEHEVEHLVDVANKGESPATPAILAGGAALVALPLAAILIGIAFAVYFAVRDDGKDASSPTRPPARAVPWLLPNGDLSNTRFVRRSSISSTNVSKLGVAWTMPLTAGGTYGTFAANPVTDAKGVVYLQDLASNVTAVDLATGRVRWQHKYGEQDLGPNGVTVAGGVVYGATATFAFALEASTGKELWRNTSLVPKSRQKGGGELANGFGIDIQPQVANGHVYLSTAALLKGGTVYALDAKTGKTVWSFDTVADPIGDKIIGGGAWNPPAIGPDGTVYIGTGNMYQPYSVAVAHPGKRLYTDSTLALDGKTGKLKWYFQAVPNDFHDWDMQLSPIYTRVRGRSLVIDSGKMGYVYAMDAASGKLVWKTKVGVHNGRDADATLALRRKLPALNYPLTVEPGVVGGVETNMAVAGGVVYVPVVNLASTWKTATGGLGGAKFGEGKGELLALDAATGRVLWDTKLPQMALGDATVVNDLVFTTTFDGHLIAFNRKNGTIVWNKKLPALTNAPIAVVGKTVIAAASFPGGPGQIAEIIGFRLGAHGTYKPAPAAAPSARGSGPADGASLFTENCASCHTLAAAHANGAVGPNLDQLKPSKAVVANQVTNGGGGMPSFGGRLSAAQIEAIAAYVARSTQ